MEFKSGTKKSFVSSQIGWIEQDKWLEFGELISTAKHLSFVYAGKEACVLVPDIHQVYSQCKILDYSKKRPENKCGDFYLLEMMEQWVWNTNGGNVQDKCLILCCCGDHEREMYQSKRNHEKSCYIKWLRESSKARGASKGEVKLTTEKEFLRKHLLQLQQKFPIFDENYPSVANAKCIILDEDSISVDEAYLEIQKKCSEPDTHDRISDEEYDDEEYDDEGYDKDWHVRHYRYSALPKWF